MPKKEVNSYRECYILTFKDDNYSINWKTGNLSRFLRNLWSSNKSLREIYPEIKTAREFGSYMVMKIGSQIKQAADRNSSTAPFYLAPRGHKLREYYSGFITRMEPTAIKGLQKGSNGLK